MLEHIADQRPMFAVSFFEASDRTIETIRQGRLNTSLPFRWTTILVRWALSMVSRWMRMSGV
ncbi:MAG: hypothetical protein R3C49_10685 [Planctomycetaceae bacterium]